MSSQSMNQIPKVGAVVSKVEIIDDGCWPQAIIEFIDSDCKETKLTERGNKIAINGDIRIWHDDRKRISVSLYVERNEKERDVIKKKIHPVDGVTNLEEIQIEKKQVEEDDGIYLPRDINTLNSWLKYYSENNYALDILIHEIYLSISKELNIGKKENYSVGFGVELNKLIFDYIIYGNALYNWKLKKREDVFLNFSCFASTKYYNESYGNYIFISRLSTKEDLVGTSILNQFLKTLVLSQRIEDKLKTKSNIVDEAIKKFMSSKEYIEYIKQSVQIFNEFLKKINEEAA